MYAHPEYLIETGDLEQQLSDPALRIFDCTVFLTPGADGAIQIESGLDRWQKGHIPGSGFVDLVEAFSDTTSPLRFTMPGPDAFSAAAGRIGIGTDSRVVLYCAGPPMWATRFWWMLRAMGFDNAAVLNGGWHKWQAEERPISTDSTAYPTATFTPNPRPELFVDKTEVHAAIDDGATCIIDSLTEQMYRGEIAIAPRPGHIPGAVNVPAVALSNPNDHTLLDEEKLRAVLAPTAGRDRVITYCGGGIAATQDAFALTLLGHNNVAVYDGSLSDWATDPDMPMAID